MVFSASKMYETCSAAEMEGISVRLQEIRAYLPDGYSIRDDSTLAYNYSVQKGSMTAGEVASEIVFTENIYKRTNYEKEVETRLRKAAELLKASYPHLGWRQVWSITKGLVPAAKMLVQDYR